MNAEIRRMAEEATKQSGAYFPGPIGGVGYAWLEAFARLVAEDCVKLCQEHCQPETYEASEYGVTDSITAGSTAIRTKYLDSGG